MRLREAVCTVDLGSDATEVLVNPRAAGLDAPSLRAALERIRSLPAHVWVATSGTTGPSSRWVALSKEAILASARAVSRHLRATDSEAWIHALPSFHVGGLGIFARARLARVPVFEGLEATAAGPRWNPALFRQVAAESGAALSALVPAQLHDLVRGGIEAPRTLRAVVIGGDALAEPLRLAARGLGWNALPSYGCTECASQVATAPAAGVDPRLLPLGHVAIRTEADGRLAFRGESLLTGAAILDGRGGGEWRGRGEDEWFLSDDVGELRDGFLVLRGRASDLVKVGGEHVDLARLARILEEAVRGAGAAVDMALLAVPDDRLGAVIHAAIAAPEGSPEAASALRTITAAGGRMLPFERPRRIHYVEAIPRSELGKVRRAELLRTLRDL